jgi:urease accessory protein
MVDHMVNPVNQADVDLFNLVTLLQQADSFFPSGSVSFSWGLESLVSEQIIQTPTDLHSFMTGQLHYRWASGDRAILAAAYQAGDDLTAIHHADIMQDAMTLAKELRTGSCRAGAALLNVHAQLQTPNAQAYLEQVRSQHTPGHLAVVQGLIGHSLRLSLEQACLLAGYSFCVNVLSAAIRLSVIGHLDSQRILGALRPTLVAIAVTPPPPLEMAHAYAPMLDIASAHHEHQPSRLFSN